MKIILASGSPRRRELLTQAGIEFTVDPAEVEEITSETLPAKVVEDLSRIKAQAVSAKHPGEIILAADTVVEAFFCVTSIAACCIAISFSMDSVSNTHSRSPACT